MLLGKCLAGADVQQLLGEHVGASGHHNAIADIEHSGRNHCACAPERLHHGERETAEVEAGSIEHQECAVGHIAFACGQKNEHDGERREQKSEQGDP